MTTAKTKLSLAKFKKIDEAGRQTLVIAIGIWLGQTFISNWWKLAMIDGITGQVQGIKS